MCKHWRLAYVLPKFGAGPSTSLRASMGQECKNGHKKFAKSSITQTCIAQLHWNLTCWCINSPWGHKSVKNSTYGKTADGWWLTNFKWLNHYNSAVDCSNALKFGVWVQYWSVEIVVHYGPHNYSPEQLAQCRAASSCNASQLPLF